LFIIVLVLMASIRFLHRWPIAVGPAAVLAGLVAVRYWVEAMGVPATQAAAWSSTVGLLLSAIYLGGMGPRMGLRSSRELFAPALVIAWSWRFWVFLATLLSATLPFYKTHFFDPEAGPVVSRLASFLGFGVLAEGFFAGLIVWVLATWIARGTRQMSPG